MEHSIDTIIYSDVKICQPKQGYGFRFGCDSPILAGFAKLRKSAKVIEAGAGSGVISILLSRFHGVDVTAIELQPEMFECLQKSIELSNMTDKITPLNMNIADYKTGTQVDAIVCNPPYRQQGTGKESLSDVERIARFEIHMDMPILCKFVKSNLKVGGKFYFSYDADMLVDALIECKKWSLEPKRLQFLYPTLEKGAKLVFVECVLGAGKELKIEPPLIQNGDSDVTKLYDTIFNNVR